MIMETMGISNKPTIVVKELLLSRWEQSRFENLLGIVWLTQKNFHNYNVDK